MRSQNAIATLDNNLAVKYKVEYILIKGCRLFLETYPTDLKNYVHTKPVCFIAILILSTNWKYKDDLQ